MRYMGGKGRVSKAISEVILKHSDGGNGVYREPFVGGGAMASKMGKHFDHVHYSDIQPDLVLMWDAVLNDGWIPPTEVTLEEYQELRTTEEPSALRGFVGFGGSFGGKWFGGYARGGHNADGTPRNHQAESSRAVVKDSLGMKAKVSTNVFRASVFDLEVSEGDVVYCDPPYQNTTSYSKTDAFDHDTFWGKMVEWVDKGAHVYVSEYNAPDGWTAIWSKPLRSTVRIGSEERKMAEEKLFALGK